MERRSGWLEEMGAVCECPSQGATTYDGERQRPPREGWFSEGSCHLAETDWFKDRVEITTVE